MSLKRVLLFVILTKVFIVFEIIRADTCNESYQCISSLNQNDCSAIDAFLEVDAMVSCCPRCREGLIWGSKECNATMACLPGLQCIDGSCVLDKNNCLYAYHIPDLRQLPQCEVDGTFAAKQCKGDKQLGRCFCYSENGKRIFGLDRYKNAATMTCACSRRRYQLESEGKVSTLHCMRNGNYEPLQCDSGICWCAEEQTGRVVAGTRAVPEDLWRLLPCYNVTEMGTEYLRECESMSHAQNILRRKLSIHGTLDASIVNIQCDFDGSYGAYSITNNIASCTWRDGKTIVPYQTETDQVSQMTCDCARDHLHFEELSLICNGYGNYKPIQTINGNLFCVDRDGFSVTDYLNEIFDCNEYLYYERKIVR